jgi:hypothetical protein
MDLLEKFAQKKKTKHPGMNQCGEKGSWGGYYIPTRKGQRKKKKPYY